MSVTVKQIITPGYPNNLATIATFHDEPIRSREEALAVLNGLLDADMRYGMSAALKAIKTALEQGVI